MPAEGPITPTNPTPPHPRDSPSHQLTTRGTPHTAQDGPGGPLPGFPGTLGADTSSVSMVSGKVKVPASENILKAAKRCSEKVKP